MPHTSHLVQCPYFIHEKNRSITCEDTARTFKDQPEKDAWMDCYCDNKWCDCRYAMDLDIMYQKIEEGASMEEEKVKQIKEATKKEHKKLAMMYDAAEKRAERRKKKLDEMRTINQTLTQNNINLSDMNKRYLKRWKDAQSQLEDYQKHEAERYFQMAKLYEDRIAYLIDTYCEDKKLAEADVKAWAEGKEYALTFDPKVKEPVWVVMTREETEADEDVSESVSGASADAGPKTEE